MKAINIALSIGISVLIAALVFEGGLRLLGFAPPNTGLEFHSKLGWTKRPNETVHRSDKAGEFDVTIQTDDNGLRDDYDKVDVAKPPGVFRVLCLGDSFTLGYVLDREDLYVDLLESWWLEEGRQVELVNAGTQGYSTDQALAWLLEEGARWEPDVVLLQTYENDIFWNTQDSYNGSSKPLFDDQGELISGELTDTNPRTFLQRTAIGNTFFRRKAPIPKVAVAGTELKIHAEQGVLLNEPPEIIKDAERRTRAVLSRMTRASEQLGARFAVLPIPSHSQVDETYAVEVMSDPKKKLFGVPRDRWDPARPHRFFREAAADAGAIVLDPLGALVAAEADGVAQYNQLDWHLNAAGNRTLASYLHDALDAEGIVPTKSKEATLAALTESGPRRNGLPGWLPWFLGLWLGAGTLYSFTYRDEVPSGFLKVGGLLAVIFTIAVGGSKLIGFLPPFWAQIALIGVVIAILTFVAYKLGDRLGTIAELLKAFTLRGHWYLMPLVTVLLTVGSLLVVAASSPLAAPFIYTLF